MYRNTSGLCQAGRCAWESERVRQGGGQGQVRFDTGSAPYACLVPGRTRAGVMRGGMFGGRDKVAVKAKWSNLSMPACLRAQEWSTGVAKICGKE